MKKIKLIILFAVGMITLQGCYTILDLPDYYAEDYSANTENQSSGESAPAYEPIILIGTSVDYYPAPIVTVSNPTVTKYRNNDLEKQRTNDNTRNDSGRSSDNNTSVTRSDSYSNSSNSSNNNSSRGSSEVRNSGNGRR